MKPNHQVEYNNCTEVLDAIKNNSVEIFNTIELLKKPVKQLIELSDNYNSILNNIRNDFILNTDWNISDLNYDEDIEPVLLNYIETFSTINSIIYILLKNASNIVNYDYIHDCDDDLCVFNIYFQANLNILYSFENLNVNWLDSFLKLDNYQINSENLKLLRASVINNDIDITMISLKQIIDDLAGEITNYKNSLAFIEENLIQIEESICFKK